MKIILSVIIPVYNTEKHIIKCVNSIISNSKNDNYELVLIDDGSTDNSGTICDQLKENDNRIKVFHKENGGLSSARNYGIEHSKGEYISFVDSDDYVGSEYIDAVLSLSEDNADIIAFSHKTIYEKTNEIISNPLNDSIINVKEAISILEQNGLFNVAWNKIYKRQIINQDKLTRFKLNAEPGEDLIFNCDYFAKIKNVYTSSKCLYFYIRRDEETLANKYRKNLYEKNKEFIEKRNWFYNELNLHSKNDIYNLYNGNIQYIFACIPNMYRNGHKLNIKKRLEFYETIIKSKNINMWINSIDFDTSLLKSFKIVYNIKSKYILDLFYSLAMGARNSFQSIWIKKRTKIIYENNN